jgi:hypothetical protein
MGRHKRFDRPVSIHVRIPSSLNEQLRLNLADAVTGRPPHGAMSNLIERLLRKWLETLGPIKQPTSVNLDDLLPPEEGRGSRS